MIRAAHMLGATPWRLLIHVILPAALPNILTGIRIGLGLAWVCVVISELPGVTAGLGFVIWDAQVYLHTDKVIVGMIVIGATGTLSGGSTGNGRVATRKNFCLTENQYYYSIPSVPQKYVNRTL